MISLEDAINILESRVSVLPGEEQIPIGEARGRVLARQITAGIANPPFDRSPLDGYALRAVDIAMAARETPARLSVVGEVCAGGWFSPARRCAL